MENYIKTYIQESIETKRKILTNSDLISQIETVSNLIIDTYNSGNKVLIAGNGGSAADAQHIAAELVSKFLKDRKALSAIALTTNTSILTSIGNDFNHSLVFARQIQAHGNKGDIFLAISTSGQSKNILEGIKEAKKQGLICVGLTGMKESEMSKICDYLIKVPSQSTPIIQESHIMISHIICALVEQKFS
jgi:D-sedoheptulose 7-phosphate isomerase